MHSDDDNKNGQFDASLHLPDEPNKTDSGDANPAADLIRKKIEAAYGSETDYKEEKAELTERPAEHRSKHQQFIYELTNSGKPLHEIQTAWHEYYAALPDDEKHAVWHEFYDTHQQAARHPAASHRVGPEDKLTAPKPVPAKIIKHRSVKHRAAPKPAIATRPVHKKKSRQANPLHSLFFGLGIGGLTLFIFLFGFFNERIIAPFIQPSRNVKNIPIIAGTAVGPNPEVIIPKINVEIPVVYTVNTVDEASVDNGLENGVVHYADTALPGEDGNVVIVGHSSNNILNPGKYKFAFTLLHDLQNGDTFYLQKDGKRYTYQVYKRYIVKPTDVSVLGLADKPATATLITCDPPGTSNNRLVVTGEQISPDPSTNAPLASHNTVAQSAAVVPGNSPSLWSRLTGWFTH